MSLRKKIAIPIVIIFVLTMGISVSVTYYFSSQYLMKIERENIQTIAKSSGQLIDMWLSGVKELLVSSAGREEYKTLLRSDSEEAREKSNSALSELVKVSGSSFSSVANTKGLVIASSVPDAVKKVNVADREHFQRAMKGEVFISDVIISRTTGRPSFNVDAPIREGGNIVGVIFCVMEPEVFTKEFVDPVKILHSGYIAVCDSTGLVFAHQDKSLVLKFKLPDFDFGKELLKMNEGEIEYNFQGQAKVAYVVSCKNSGWKCIALVPKAEVSELADKIGMIGMILLVGGLLLITVVLYALVRSITHPLERIAEGLGASARQVGAAARELSSSSRQLSEGASEQAASIEETSSSLEEMSSMTRQNAANASQTDLLMREAGGVISKANESMHQLTSSMVEISRSSEDTQKIIKTIDEIAFQTNLLALNAAVEAARAGEAGAGFAVVADEVRNLAMRASEAAKNTADLIESTVKRIKEGSGMVEKTNSEFSQVTASAEKMGQLIGEISAASQEQSQGIEQVNKAVSEMDKVVQQNAANAEESASASEEMNAQAGQLNEFVGDLVALVGGAKVNRSASDSTEKEIVKRTGKVWRVAH